MTSRAIWGAGLGQGLTWGSAFSTEINSLAAGYSVLSSVSITNGTALDLYADVSFKVTGTTPSSGVPYVGFYVMPLDQDGTAYGDNTQTTTGSATNPAPTYFVGSVIVPLSVTSAFLYGTLRQVVLPPGTFKFAVINQTSNALASGSNTIQYRTYIENLNG